MGKGKDFKRKAEKLIEFCKNIQAQNYCKNEAAISTILLLVIKDSFEKEN